MTPRQNYKRNSTHVLSNLASRTVICLSKKAKSKQNQSAWDQAMSLEIAIKAGDEKENGGENDDKMKKRKQRKTEATWRVFAPLLITVSADLFVDLFAELI